MARKKGKKKSSKGKIVWDKKEFIERDDADFRPNHTDIPNSRSKPKGCGIYALYDDHGLYYVGLTDYSLRARIEKHTKNRHKGKWKRFSWYQIPNIKYTKDIESIILRIVDPKGNRVKGKFKTRRKRKTK